MNIEYFNEFLNNLNKGIKTKAKEYITKFISSFENFEEKEKWTMGYLQKLTNNNNLRIRNELFEEIVFPVLINGYNNKNIVSMIWLVKLSQNYYQNNRIWEKMNYKTDYQIIKECYELEPNNNEIIELYLELEIEKINFSIHEWPYGILFGNSFATKEECKLLLEKVEFVKGLDQHQKYKQYISDYKSKILEYIEK